MAILVGIDEAGYGPLLGPMVVSAVALELPDGLLRSDLWAVFSKAVSAHKKALAGRILIIDSKKAYSRNTGINTLRRTVLSSLYAWKNGTTSMVTAADLMNTVCPDLLGRIDTYPWYTNVRNHSLGHDTNDVSIAAAVLRKTMAENDARFISIRSKCLDVNLYNERIRKVKNKSRVLFTELCSLILETFEAVPAETGTIQILVDRQGGRVNYERELLRMFEGFSLSVLRQDPKMSSYELSRSRKSIRIHFCTKADTKYLVVSLASMVSKYVREIMVGLLNEYFCGQCPQLNPTAGYWQDGQRFLNDLSIHLPTHPEIHEKLVRIS